MVYRYEVEVTVSFARDLKNVNWRYGPTRPYAVLWIDPNNKCTTRADDSGDTCPRWDQTLLIPVPPLPIEDATLYIDVVHAGSEEGTKRLIGSARLRLKDVIDDVGFRERSNRTLQLKRPSGRPQGKIEIEVAVREPGYPAPDPYAAPPYGVPPQSRDVYGRPTPYGVPPPTRDFYGGSQSYGYPYGAPPPPNPYYGGEAASGYQYGYGEEKKKKKKKSGMGTGLAIGAVGGALGAVALMEGADWVEDKIDDKVDDAVEEALEDDAGE